MRYYKRADGSLLMCASEMPDLTEISKEEYEPEKSNVDKRIQTALFIAERTRPLTAEEVTVLLIKQQINTLEVDDNTALRMTEFYPEWEAGQAYTAGYKVQRSGNLWRCLQDHTSQAGWEPSINTASLWEEICEAHTGTLADPIPYSGNMALESGKYYIQDYVIYRCTRDTVNPVYNPMAELVGLYVEVAE